MTRATDQLIVNEALASRIDQLERELSTLKRELLTPPPPSPTFTIAEVAELSGYSPQAIRGWCADSANHFAERDTRGWWVIHRVPFREWWRARFGKLPAWLL
jgi:hypothetical protein